MQSIVDSCGCHESKQSDSRDRGPVTSLPITYCANSLLYVDFIHSLPRFGGYDSCLVVTCGLTRFTRAFPRNKKITGEQTVNTLLEQWFEHYGAPKEVHSDADVRIRSDTEWYKQVLDAPNVHVTTDVPYTHTSNPLCERQNHVLEQNLRILMKQQSTKEWVGLIPPAVLTMNSQESSSPGYTPHELFNGGRPAWFFKTPFPEDHKSPVWDWLEHRQDLANLYRTQNRERTIGSHSVDQILSGSARSDRRFVNRTQLTYVKANNQTRNTKCMNRHFQLKEHTEGPGLKRATLEFHSLLSVPDLASP